jgi:hypothetical protein
MVKTRTAFARSINKTATTFDLFTQVEKYAYPATLDEISKKFNLNIPCVAWTPSSRGQEVVTSAIVGKRPEAAALPMRCIFQIG